MTSITAGAVAPAPRGQYPTTAPFPPSRGADTHHFFNHSRLALNTTHPLFLRDFAGYIQITPVPAACQYPKFFRCAALLCSQKKHTLTTHTPVSIPPLQLRILKGTLRIRPLIRTIQKTSTFYMKNGAFACAHVHVETRRCLKFERVCANEAYTSYDSKTLPWSL